MEKSISYDEAVNILSNAKPNQEIEIQYRSSIKGKAKWERETGCKLYKISRVTTITNADYNAALQISRDEAEAKRSAAKAEAEANGVEYKERTRTVNPDAPKKVMTVKNCILSQDDKHWLLVYGREKWDLIERKYSIWDSDDNCIAMYDSIDDITDFVIPSALKSGDNMPTMMTLKLENIYELNLR